MLQCAPASPTLHPITCPTQTEVPDYRFECSLLVLPTGGSSASAQRDTVFLALHRAVTRPAPTIVYLPGGPGSGATDQLELAWLAMESLLGTHDVLFVDQRGTGRSSGPRCHNRFTGDRWFDPSAVAACVRVASAAGDLSRFSTSTYVDDLERVRLALRIDTLALYGLSHGSRAAMLYGHRYRARVRRMVLDSPAPWGDVLSHAPAAAARALDVAATECTADVQCRRRVGDLQRLLRVTLDRLDSTPLALAVTADTNGPALPVELTGRGLANLVWQALYTAEGRSGVSGLVRSAADGDTVALATVLRPVVREDEAHNLLVQLHAMCTEYQRPPLAPEAPTSVAPHRALVDDLAAACRPWPGRGAGRSAVVDTIPHAVLAFTGELDPITPPEVLTLLPLRPTSSLRFVVRYGGHASDFPCTREPVAAFLRGADPQHVPVPECALRWP